MKKKNSLNKKNKNAFSLLEISVVLVVISLIVAATLQGQNLMKAMRLKSVISQASEYKIAISSFYTKYSAYPGDYEEASVDWGTSIENGDANYLIEYKNSQGIYEGYNAWSQLYYAEIISVKYNNVHSNTPLVGVDIPDSKIKGSGFVFDANRKNFSNTNVLLFGKPLSSNDFNAKLNSALKPQEAYSIDSKLDDGIPNKGNIKAEDGNDSSDNCSTSENQYKLSNKNESCILVFGVSLE